MKKCPRCGAENENHVKYCWNCGLSTIPPKQQITSNIPPNIQSNPQNSTKLPMPEKKSHTTLMLFILSILIILICSFCANINRNIEMVDKTELINTIVIAEQVDTSKFLPITKEQLNKAIANARTVVTDKKATETDVIDAKMKLNDIINNPELIPDKTNLLNKLEEVLSLDMSSYTDFSKQALQIQIEAAKKVLGNENTTEKDVTSTLENLERAINNLEIKNEMVSDDKEEVIDKPQSERYAVVEKEDVSVGNIKRISLVIEFENSNISLSDIKEEMKHECKKYISTYDVVFIYASTSKRNTIVSNYATRATWINSNLPKENRPIVSGDKFEDGYYWKDYENYKTDEEFYNEFFGSDDEILEIGIPAFNELVNIYNTLLTSLNTKSNYTFTTDANGYEEDVLRLWNELGDTYFSDNYEVNDFIENSRVAALELLDVTRLNPNVSNQHYAKTKLENCHKYLSLAETAYNNYNN